jgi:hypothetical protein
MYLTILGWVTIIVATIIARWYLQRHVFRMPTDLDRFRSWRYRRAIRTSLRRNQRQLKRARNTYHVHQYVVFGADKGTLVERCSVCGATQEA